VCEYINRENFRPKALFATHYHELTELNEHRQGIKNFNVTVKEIEDDILFIRKVVPGGADRSYGIHVGKLAGLPMEIINRAEEILLCLEEEKISDQSITAILKKKKDHISIYDLPLFKPLKKQTEKQVTQKDPGPQHAFQQNSIIMEIKNLDISSLTPLQALVKIDQWKNDIKNNKSGISLQE
jgi:DNA mismatch repair protein MutS